MNLRRLRLRAVWLLVVPFLWFARPEPGLLLVGAVVALVGLVIRGWAAGTIHKERELTTSGPYAHVRHPLYLGSLFIGLGVTIAGGQWVFVALFLAFYLGVYSRTMSGETELLAGLFGDRFEHWRARVPAFVPRPTPYRAPEGTGAGFRWGRYRRNREWEAALGVVGAFAFLALRWVLAV